MVDESGFLYKKRDPIFDMTKEEFQDMLKEFDIELEYPSDLVGHSINMWRAKWVFRILKVDKDAFEQDEEKVESFKRSLY